MTQPLVLVTFPMVSLKFGIYVNRSRTQQDLKTNIRTKIGNITPATLTKVMTNDSNRFRQRMEFDRQKNVNKNFGHYKI